MKSNKRRWYGRSGSAGRARQTPATGSDSSARNSSQQPTLSSFFGVQSSSQASNSSLTPPGSTNTSAAAKVEVVAKPASSTLSKLQKFNLSCSTSCTRNTANDSNDVLGAGESSEPQPESVLSSSCVSGASSVTSCSASANSSGVSWQPPVSVCVSSSDSENEDNVPMRLTAQRQPATPAAKRPRLSSSSASKAARVPSPVRQLLPFTPLEKQYMAVRDANPGVLLMVECGYKFRFFGEDAEIAARVLNIFCHPIHNFMNASIPVGRLPVHVRRLAMAGYKVGVVRQTETAAHKAAGDNRNTPFERRLTDVYTRATLIGEEFDSPLPSQSFRRQPPSASAATINSVDSFTSSGHAGRRDDDHDDGDADLGNTALTGDASELTWSNTADSYLMFIVDSDPEDLDKDLGGMTSDGDVHTGGCHHYLAIVAVRPATGELVYSQFGDDSSRCQLLTHLVHIVPCEVLTPGNVSDRTRQAVESFVASRQQQGDLVRLEDVPAAWNDYGSSYGCLSDFFRVSATASHSLSDDDSCSSDDDEAKDEADNGRCNMRRSNPDQHWQFVQSLPKPVVVCLGLALRHLKQFNLASILHDTDNYSQFTNTQLYMVLTEQSLRSLEIFCNTLDGKERGSLFSLMVNTSTAFGRRLFRQWLAKPLTKRSAICDRHNAVEEMVAHFKTPCVKQLRGLLSHLPDIERGMGSVRHKKCSTNDFFTTLQALVLVRREMSAIQDEALSLLRSPLLVEAFNEVPSLLDGVQAFFDCLHGKAAKSGDKIELFKNLSKFPELSKTKKALQEIDAALLSHRRDVRLKLGMPALEYKTVSGDDYLVEVSNKIQHKVPTEWSRINSTKQVSRYRSPFIVSQLKQRALLRETLAEQSQVAWVKFLTEFSSKLGGRCRRACQHLATLDCLLSLAKLASQPGYVKPHLLDTDEPCEVSFVNGWHPVVAALVDSVSADSQFVANSAAMTQTNNRVSIITGPNMGGKSCFVRQVALIAVMCQMGSFVPADSARLSVLDGVYVRMGASDDLEHGRSTFMVELQETAEVLRRATPRSLVILDELGRGTSTHDGVAIAYSTLDYLITKIHPLVLFVTHYPQLAQLCDLYPDVVRAFHMSFLEAGDDSISITFLYQLVAGLAARSYGLNVARLAGIPADILELATSKSEELEKVVARRSDLVERFRSRWRGAVTAE